MGKKAAVEMLTTEEKELLVDVLFSQNYVKEILASEMADLENRMTEGLWVCQNDPYSTV